MSAARPVAAFTSRIASLPCAAVLLAWAWTAGAFDVEDGYEPELDGTVNALAVQQSGHGIVGGDFTRVNGVSCARLCRLDAAGQVAAGFGPTGLNGDVFALLVEPDGAVIVGGAFTQGFGQAFSRVLRLNADGSIASPALAGTNGSVRALLRQADGRLLIGGDFTQVGGSWPSQRIARLHADGSVDTSFRADVGGTVHAIAVLDDGRIVVGGAFQTVGGGNRQRLAVLQPNGLVDFNTAFNANDTVRTLTRDNDGTLIIGGDFTQIAGIALARLARMTPDGGIVYGLATAEAGVRATLLHSGGQLILGGDFLAIDELSRARLARLDQERQLESTWRAVTGDSVHAIAEQPDGSLLVGGRFVSANGEPRSRLARVTPQGQLERTLSSGANPESAVLAVVEQHDGGLLLGGDFDTVAGQARENLARLEPSGSVDPAFAPTVGNGSVRALAALPNGSVLLAGDFTAVNGNPRNALAKLRADGSLDNSFQPPDFSGPLFGMRLAQNNQLYVAGTFARMGQHTSAGVARLSAATGSVDTAFRAAVEPRALNVLEQPDGRVLVIGATEVDGVAQPAGLSRLLRNGRLDPEFLARPGENNRVNAAALLPDGRILVAYSRPDASQHFVRRLLPDGSLDTLDPGFVTIADGPILSLALRADGLVAISGEFTTIFNARRSGYALLGPTGVATSVALPAADDSVVGVHFQHDGKLLLYGTFETVGGMPRSGLARLSSPQAALYSLEQAGGSLRWLRGGAAPEIYTVPRIAISGFGQPLPESAPLRRVAGGWQFDGLDLASGGAPLLRLQLQTDTPRSHGTGRYQREYQRFNPRLFSDGFEPGNPN
jgi:uncharacterized delta-60 repeat protein